MANPVWDQIEGKWHQLKGSVQTRWAELTDNDVDEIAGRYENLMGMLQERYGKTRVELEQEIDEWIDTLE
jgi:uncharacterized protein YjbJ (UPF0337 family)